MPVQTGAQLVGKQPSAEADRADTRYLSPAAGEIPAYRFERMIRFGYGQATSTDPSSGHALRPQPPTLTHLLCNHANAGHRCSQRPIVVTRRAERPKVQPTAAGGQDIWRM